MKTKLIPAIAAIVMLAAATAAVASRSTASQVKTKTTSLGTILVDGKSHTLYMFMKDKAGKSSCAGPCAVNWPPYLTTAKPTAAAGVKASLLGTTKRTDGKPASVSITGSRYRRDASSRGPRARAQPASSSASEGLGRSLSGK